MRKIFMTLAACALAATVACNTEKKANTVAEPTIADLAGEWEIVNVSGTPVTPAEGQDVPFLGFNVSEGSLYGNAGCNRLLGSFDVNSKPGELTLGNTGSTRMLCPDMTIEDLVLPALGEVRKYRFVEGGDVEMLDGEGKIVFYLKPRPAQEESKTDSIPE